MRKERNLPTVGASHARHGKAQRATAEVGGPRSSHDPVPGQPTGENIGERRGAAMNQETKRSKGCGDGSQGLPAPEDKVRKLQIVLYRKAKAEPKYRFWSLYGELMRRDVLERAWRQVKANGGAAGVDGQTIKSIATEPEAEAAWLEELQRELQNKMYRVSPVRRVWIPKTDGGKRPLGIPTAKDRVVQTALAILLMPIWEADFHDHSHGYRPSRNTHGAMKQIEKAIASGLSEVVDADLSKYFDTIPHRKLLRLVALRVSDGAVLRLIKGWLRAPVMEEGEDGKRRVSPSERGTPQGGVISPLLANLYLNALDWGVDRIGRWQCRMVRYADDLVILCQPGRGKEMLGRLQRWLEARGLELNKEKTRLVEATTESLNFLGFCVTWRRSRRAGRGYAHVEPSGKSRQSYRAAVREILNNATQCRPVTETIRELNRMSRGWATAFDYGNNGKVFHQLAYYTTRKLQTWLWRKHGCSKGRFRHYTLQRMHQRYGLWRWPLQPKYRRTAA